MEDNNLSPKKKGPLVLDWNIIMPESKDDDPPPEIVVDKTRADFVGMTDYCIDQEIVRQRGNLEKIKNLPDNGAKLRARVKSLEEERERRRLVKEEREKKLRQLNSDGAAKPLQSERENNSNASDELKEKESSSTSPHGSEFAACFNKKLDERQKDNKPENAFGNEFSHSGGNRQNRRLNRQNSTKRKLSNSDQNRQCSKSQDTLPKSFKKIQKRFPPLSSNCSTRSSTKTYFLVDEDDSEPDVIEQTKQVEKLDERTKDSTIYYPSRDDPESVEICLSDMECLAPQAFLSSTVMNFYIRHLQEPTLAMEKRSVDYHFFNTYFYIKLQKALSRKDVKESTFPKLRRWWKGVNIFQKAYIFLPVNKDLHWSLVIICMPDKDDDCGPIMLHLDSLGLHNSRPIFSNVKSFLVEEWKHLGEEKALLDLPISHKIGKNLSRRIVEECVEVPVQKNDYDCGLFVLYYMERFIDEVSERLKRQDLKTIFSRRWFKAEEASDLRGKIKKLLHEEFEKASQGKCDSAESIAVVDDEESTMVDDGQKSDQPIVV